MPEGVAKDHVHVEALGVVVRGCPERDDDVRMAELGVDVVLDVALAPVELAEYLMGRVAAAGAVAGELPRPPQLLGRRQEDADVVGVAKPGEWKLRSPSATTNGHGRTYSGADRAPTRWS